MPTAFSCFSSPPPCRGQLPVGGCLAIIVLLIKNSATQYCIRASVTFFVSLRLLSWAQLLFGNSKRYFPNPAKDFLSFSPILLSTMFKSLIVVGSEKKKISFLGYLPELWYPTGEKEIYFQ